MRFLASLLLGVLAIPLSAEPVGTPNEPRKE